MLVWSPAILVGALGFEGETQAWTLRGSLGSDGPLKLVATTLN